MAKAMSPNLFQKALQKQSRLKAIATPEKKGRGRPKSDDPAITFPTTLKQSEANEIGEFADKLKTSLNGFGHAGKAIPINFEEHLNGNTLGSEEALDLLRICQEAVHNSLKHSGCSAVKLSIRAEGKGYQIKIEDNGIGIDPEANHDGHYGIENMKERAKQIGAQFSIQSDNGKGTTVVVSK